MTTLVEFEIEHGNNALAEPLSEEFTCWAARKASGKSRQQAMFFELTAGVEKLGACTSVLMPYTQSWNPNEQPSAEALKQSMVYRDRWRPHWIRRWAYEPRVSEQEMEQMKRAIADEHPLAIGMRWPNSNSPKDLLKPPAAKEVFDGHCVTLVGYEDNASKPGGGVFILRDSDGPQWGNGGYTPVSYAYVRQYANDIFWMQYCPPHSEKPLHRFEAEKMRQIKTHQCTATDQDMSQWEAPLWSAGHQLFCNASNKGSVELSFEVPKSSRYRVRALATAAPDYGIIRAELDGKPVGPHFNLYAGQVCPAGSLELGVHDLHAGEHRLLFTAIGKSVASNGYSFGLDTVDLMEPLVKQ
jgi:hypothetical protein